MERYLEQGLCLNIELVTRDPAVSGNAMPKELEDWFQDSLPMVCKRLLITTNCSDFCFQPKWIAIANSQSQFHIGHKGVIWINSLWFTTISAEFRLLTSSILCCHTPSYSLGPKFFMESKNRREEGTMEQLVPWSKDGRADFWCTNRTRALMLNQCWVLLWFLLETLGLRVTRIQTTHGSSWRQKQALTEKAWYFGSGSRYGDVLPWHSGWHCFGKAKGVALFLSLHLPKGIPGLHGFSTSLANPFKLCPIHRLQDSRAWYRTRTKPV